MPSYRLYRIIRALRLREIVVLSCAIFLGVVVLLLLSLCVIIITPPLWVLYPDFRYRSAQTGSRREREICERYRRLGRRMSIWRRIAKIFLKPFGLWNTYW